MRYTLNAPCSWEQTLRRSRFVARAFPVDAVSAIEPLLKREHMPSASHHCWAWRVGTQYRFFDDGEPAGSAGRPILAAIDGQDLDRVLVLVVRFFGGIKLGVGGLMRAYGSTAARCLEQADKRPWQALVRVGLLCPFDRVAQVHGLLSRMEAKKQREAYRPEGLWLELELPQQQQAELADALLQLSRGQVVLQTL